MDLSRCGSPGDQLVDVATSVAVVIITEPAPSGRELPLHLEKRESDETENQGQATEDDPELLHELRSLFSGTILHEWKLCFADQPRQRSCADKCVSKCNLLTSGKFAMAGEQERRYRE